MAIYSKALSVMAGVCVLLGMATVGDRAAAREKLSLDGEWNFATDPDNRGETEQWYRPAAKLPAMPLPGYARTADGKIQVPGIWDNQGYGVETDKVRHQFIGKGWYRRTAAIPAAWAGQRVFLAVTGVSRCSKVWVNEKYLGAHVGYLSSQEYDVTSAVTPGQTATITIQVDSQQHWEVDAMYGTAALADYMDIAWGGIWGHVYLEARPDAWLSGIYVQPNVADSSCTVSATLNGKAELFDGALLEVLDAAGKCVATATASVKGVAAGQRITVKAVVPNAKLWTPDTPTLYTARLSLRRGDKSCDALATRFGMRQFSADGPHLLLNGKRIMLCGYGDDHIYPEQMALPSDKELYLKRLRTIKSFGFNHVRHHSTFMPPEYYEACDEVGIITAAEFAIAYRQFMPGIGPEWRAKVKPGTNPGPALETYQREWADLITQHRNHPSILCWVRANELYDEPLMRDEFARIAKQLDPDRWYVDTDGTWVQDPKKDRDTLPICFVQFAEWANPIDNAEKHKTPPVTKPMISHEASNYVTFSRPDLVDQFRHNFKPFWLSAGKEKLAKLGLAQEANAWADKSERLYALLQKHNFEWLRHNPYISGYHWWLFQDYWTSSNGLVDHYFRPKSITPAEVLKFNNAVVLLQSGLERTYQVGGPLKLKLLLSNFSPAPLGGKLTWKLQAGAKTAAEKELSIAAVPQGELAEVAQVQAALPEVAAPTPLTVTVVLDAGGKRYTNDWTSWLYPAAIQPAPAVPVYADQRLFEVLPFLKQWKVAALPDDETLPRRAVYLVDGLYEPRVTAALAEGACVAAFGGVDFLTARPITYRTTWWKAGDSPTKNHCGTFVYDHPLTRAMAPDGWCDAGWFDLLEGSRKYVLEKAPVRPRVIVRALPSMACVEDDALLFEVSVGKGCLLASGLNHRRGGDRPENQWLVAQMIDYAAGLPHPQAAWPAAMLHAAYDAPAGCLPGFRRLLSNQGEQGDWYSYREDHAPQYVCRQTAKGHDVAWETTPLPSQATGERVTFTFAGGLGYSSQPKTEGFMLQIDGRDQVRFDIPGPDRWSSADKRIELRFEQRRAVTEDHMGVFYLTLPRDMLTPGKTCRLAVRSLGSGSQRWFGLNPYVNTK